MIKNKEINCKCRGLDPACPDCDGMGKLVLKAKMNEDFMFNVLLDPNKPFWRMKTSTHVTCALCKRKIKRRKFNKHLSDEHPDYNANKGGIIKFEETRKRKL